MADWKDDWMRYHLTRFYYHMSFVRGLIVGSVFTMVTICLAKWLYGVSLNLFCG